MKSSILILSFLMTSVCFADGNRYKTIYDDKKVETAKPSTDLTEKSPIEVAVEKYVIEALGEQSRYKSNNKRVIGVNLIEQIAGIDKGKLLLDLTYISDPDMLNNVNKDGLIIDAMRVIASLSKDKKIKAKVGEVMLRPHVVVKDGAVEQLAKFQIRLADLKGPNWDGVTGMYFENLLKQSGKINITPYFINNGGKFLVLKKEQLNL